MSPTDMKKCLLCPKEQHPSQARVHCLPRMDTFLVFDEPLGLMLTSVMLTLASLTMLFLVMSLRRRDLPVIRANDRALSCMLLTSLTLPSAPCSSSAVPPLPPSFSTRQPLLSCSPWPFLPRGQTVVLAFRVTGPGNRASGILCLHPGCPHHLMMRVFLCGVRLGNFLPFPDRDSLRVQPRCQGALC